MGSSVIPAPSGTASDNWVLISSVTPTASATTVSFTSISGYKKLLLAIRNPGASATAAYNLTFNSDTGSNYAYAGISITSSTVNYTSGLGATSNIPLGSAGPGNLFTNLTINEVNTTGAKNLSGFYSTGAGANTVIPTFQATYFASAAITSVTLTIGTGTFLATGTVAIYGVAA